MDVLNFSETRAKLKSVMDKVVRDHAPVVISRKNGEAVVLVSLADWNAMDETNHLLSTRANREALAASLAEFDAGKGEEHDLIDP